LMNQNHFRRYIFSWAFCLCLDLEKWRKWYWCITSAGLPNDKNNNNWGSTFKILSTKTRNP
jgi:mannan endo-1,4-beta-mannosidase